VARRWTGGLLAFALVLSGCLGGGEKETAEPGGPLTVYASLPLGGVSGDEGRAVSAGIRLAFRDARDRAGAVPVQLVTLDSTKGRGAPWDPGQVQANAERAADDPRAIAYIGELDLGASAISVPETNDADLLQVSPYDGLTSLTRSPPGRAGRGAPVRYYPRHRRSFVRLVPNDLREADAIVGRMASLGTTRVALVTGQGVYGSELAAQLAQRIRGSGGTVVASEELEDEPESARSAVEAVEESRPDAVVYSGVGDRSATELLAELATRPAVPVMVTGGTLVRRPLPFGPAPAQVEAFSPFRPAGRYGRWGRSVLAKLRRADGVSAGRPEALYGYEAARLVLDAVREGGRRRLAVVRAGLRPRTRRSPIGRYEVDRRGDVSGEPLLLYRLEAGQFEPDLDDAGRAPQPPIKPR
jgi:branched-chain amino acid transport system substrate-binding protein